MPLCTEYLDLLGTVLEVLTNHPRTPLVTTGEVIRWLHQVSPRQIRNALRDGEHDLSSVFVRCLLKETRHPLLPDWTPEQIADWCHRTRPEDVHFVLFRQRAA